MVKYSSAYWQVFAINWGLELASSNIVAFCDADDVWLSPITMKKTRPATKISVLCTLDKEAVMAEILFKNFRAIRRTQNYSPNTGLSS